MKPINKKYSLRDFYTEEGKSLKCNYKHYWATFVRYREMQVCSESMYKLFKKLYRVNGWHKMSVINRNIGKGYSASDIGMARIER